MLYLYTIFPPFGLVNVAAAGLGAGASAAQAWGAEGQAV
jgi:hypothetical protein